MPPPKDAPAKKRKPEPIPSETPVKRTKHAETPSKPRDQDIDFMSPAISRKLFSPAAVTSLGPTPQRDGRVLGLFDLMVEKELGTPSKKENDGGKAHGRGTVQATPSKRRLSIDDESATRLGRTPMSTGKRQMLNDFMTPLKKRDANAASGKTPTSVSKLQFDTPAFLKRHSLPTVDEDGQFNAPVSSLKLPRKPLVRGLSEIVASLRKVEEEVHDDDEDALREAEGIEMGGAPPPKPRPQPRDEVLVEDSQVQQLPLGGFDDEGLYDSPVEDALGRDGNPLKVYKKKGQKRTTRRVNMRPTRTKRPANMGEGGDSEDDDEVLAPETQAAGGDADAESGSDFDAAADARSKPVNVKAKTVKGPKEGTAKKAVRKVNELAHANFRSLKLRNYGAKGGPGHNSRFRRKR